MSFYRKYRPLILEELDNADVKAELSKLLMKDRQDLPHAYLLTGPRGAGKTTTARIIAKMYNCSTPLQGRSPCGECPQCVSIANGTNLDVIEIDAASNRGIDEMRLLRERIGLSPSSAPYTVYIIDEVHMLTNEAFNALLKTLEEPPKHAIFVLATTDPQKIPQTVISRCMKLAFRKATPLETQQALKRIVIKEAIPADDAVLARISQYADGSFRDAVKYLEQVSFSNGSLTVESVEKSLSLSYTPYVRKLLEALSVRDRITALSIVDQAVNTGMDIKSFATDILQTLRTEYINCVTGKTTQFQWNTVDVSVLLKKLMAAFGDFKYSPIVQMPIEIVITEFCIEEPSRSFASGTRQEPASMVPSKLPDAVKSTEMKDIAQPMHKPALKPSQSDVVLSDTTEQISQGLLTLEKLTECWLDVIEELKPYNHSVAGVLRSARPKNVSNDSITLEAFYKFHQEKLSESKTKDALASAFKKLFGVKVKVDVVLGKK